MSDAGRIFERSVLEFCQRKWPKEKVHENRYFGDREVDVFVDLDDEVYILECTIERGKKKAEHDIAKIRDCRKTLLEERPNTRVFGLFITQHEPSPDVHQVAMDNGSWISALSLSAFVARHFASSSYLTERPKRPFGSVRSPIDDSPHLGRNLFVPVNFKTRDDQAITIEQLVEDIVSGKRTRLVLTGDFGLGKSMTFRELYYRLSDKFYAGEIYRFPIYINLRDSTFDETDEVVDILERHAKWVGIRNKRDEIVQAWTSDCTILLLDGFDEVIRSGFTGLTTSSHDIRFASSHIIREFVTNSHRNTPIFICGRESYFVTDSEMDECLGTQNFSHASLHDLQEREVKELFFKLLPRHKNFFIFDWLPQRPLLLAYLYFKIAQDGDASDERALTAASPGEGWDNLLTRLCIRETVVAKGAAPEQIRRLLERVALYGRTNLQETGHVTSLHVAQAYRDVFRAEPDLSVQQVLMRLPGLTAGRADEVRRFIDNSFFEAAQAGTVAEAVAALSTKDDAVLASDEYRPLIEQLRRTVTAISPLTAQISLHMLRTHGTLGALYTALDEASHRFSGNLVADLLICHLANREAPKDKTGRQISISECHIPILEITDENIRNDRLNFSHMIIGDLEIAVSEEKVSQLRFESVRVGHLRCSVSLETFLRTQGLSATESVTHFDATSNDLLTSNLPDALKAMKICLRKLFRQPGAGRLRSSFYRGIGPLNPALIDDCIAILVHHDIIYFTGLGKSENAIFYPNRAQTRRVSAILDAPGIHTDIIVSTIMTKWT